MCEKLAAKYRIESLPTVVFIRGNKEVDRISEGGSRFISLFSDAIGSLSTAEELSTLKSFLSSSAQFEDVAGSLSNMATSQEHLSVLVSQPLKPAAHFVSRKNRESLGMMASYSSACVLSLLF